MGGLVRAVLLFLLLLLLARAVLRFFGGIVQGVSGGPPPRPGPQGGTPPTKMVQDPVCGTYVVPARALQATRGRETVFFCSDACRQQYLARS